MKIFLAADLEGCASVATWEEIYPGNKNYDRATDEMTREVAAACKALLDEGNEVYLKDSHFEGKNIDFSKLPAGVKIIRNHGGHPDMMIQGIDETFDAAAFIGFHTGASMPGNPLAHTMNRKITKMMINGMVASEYLLHVFVAAEYGVPVIMVSGDKGLCDWINGYNPAVETAVIKNNNDSCVETLTTEEAQAKICEALLASLGKVEECGIELPEVYEVEMTFKEISDAATASYYPGVEKVDANTVRFTAHSARELMTTRMFIQ